MMLTGDHHQVAKTIASDLGMTHFLIRDSSRSKGSRNYRTNGSEWPWNRHKLTLMSGEIQGIDKAMQLDRTPMRMLHQNLKRAFGYNLVLVPLAGCILYPLFQRRGGVPHALQWIFREYGFLQPIMAAAAMALSSVSMVTNSLLLKRISLEYSLLRRCVS